MTRREGWDNEDAIYDCSANHPLQDDENDPLDKAYWELQKDVPEGAWATASGDIKISEMTDDHLRNAIAWAARNEYEGSGKLAELRTELAKRSGDDPAECPECGSFHVEPGFCPANPVRKQIRDLIVRGNVTLEENESIRCNSYEREALIPVLTDEAFCKTMQYALNNCSVLVHRRPFSTYDEAVIGLHAPELLKRFGQARAALIAAEGTYQEVLVILRVLVPMLPEDAREAVQELIDLETPPAMAGDAVAPRDSANAGVAGGDYERAPDGHINNCALANRSPSAIRSDEERSCQVCKGRCPDRERHRW